MDFTLPRLDTNLRKALIKESVDKLYDISKWIALLDMQVKITPYRFSALRPLITEK